MSTTKPTAPTTSAVSDDLLNAFDNIVDAGHELPLDQLQQRYAESTFFQYQEYKIYNTVMELPVTVDMVVNGKSDPVARIMAGLKEMHGDDLLVELVAEHGHASLRVRMWKPEAALRRVWKEFAEATYKTQLAVAS